MQHHAADQLHVEMAHVEDAAAGFADHRKGFHQQVVQRRTLGQPLFEFDGLGCQVDIGKRAHGGLEIVYGRHGGQHGLDLAFGFSAKYFCQNGVNNHVKVSLRREIPNFYFNPLCKRDA